MKCGETFQFHSTLTNMEGRRNRGFYNASNGDAMRGEILAIEAGGPLAGGRGEGGRGRERGRESEEEHAEGTFD